MAKRFAIHPGEILFTEGANDGDSDSASQNDDVGGSQNGDVIARSSLLERHSERSSESLSLVQNVSGGRRVLSSKGGTGFPQGSLKSCQVRFMARIISILRLRCIFLIMDSRAIASPIVAQHS